MTRCSARRERDGRDGRAARSAAAWIRATLLLASLVALAPSATAQEAPPPTKRHDTPALLREPQFLTMALDFVGDYVGDASREYRENGFYADVSGIVSGAGWLSVGPGYHHRLFGDRAIVDLSAAISWRAYKAAQARIELPNLARSRLAVGSQLRWHDFTQVHYFGIGPASIESARSQYRVKTADVVGYVRYRPTRWLSMDGRVGRLTRPTLSSPAGPFRNHDPDPRVVFAAEPGFDAGPQPAFVHGELSVTADTRDYPGHPSAGGLYRAAGSRYSDRDRHAFSFDRYELEALHLVPLFRGAWVIGLHGWGAFTGTAPGQEVPAYLLPSLGGGNTLRAYPNFRFHDRSLLLATAESRWALTPHLDAALFVDTGSVAARAGDLRLANASWGGGLRVHTHSSTTVRLDVAHGREGWEVVVRTHDPFGLTRLTRLTSVIPFVP